MFNTIPRIEKENLITNLKNGFRQDYRVFQSYRNINLKKLYENGQIEVNIGFTRVIGQIFSSLVSPLNDKPNEGMIMFNIDSSNLKHIAEANNSNDEISELRSRISNLLEKSLKDTK